VAPLAQAGAHALGVDDNSRLMFQKSRQGNQRAWASVSEKMARFRSGAADNVRFDDKDRKDQDEAQ
jgi:hypothetical protein